MTAGQHLRDFLYLDTDKAASIFSQLYGGLVEGTQEATEQASERRRGVAINLGVLTPELRGGSSDRTSVVESRVLHHALLLEIEEGLFEAGAAVDLNAAFDGPPNSVEDVRSALADASYVRVEGWAAIEDYDRISSIATEFPALVEFINKSVLAGVEQSDEYKALRAGVEAMKTEARQLPDKQARNRALKEIGEQEKHLEEVLRSSIELLDDGLQPWFVEGLKLWLRVFLPGRITLRIYPFENLPAFQVFGNLKRDSFVDADLGNLLFAYGARPNVKLTLMGLVTSFPSNEGVQFNPLGEFKAPDAGDETEHPRTADPTESQPEQPSEESDPAAFERAFRGVFEGMEGMEGLARFSRYPNVTVYPLAVYRRVSVADDVVA